MAKGATDIRNLNRDYHERILDIAHDHRVATGIVYNHILADFFDQLDKEQKPDFFDDLPGSRHAKKNHAARVTASRHNGHDGGMSGP